MSYFCLCFRFQSLFVYNGPKWSTFDNFYVFFILLFLTKWLYVSFVKFFSFFLENMIEYEAKYDEDKEDCYYQHTYEYLYDSKVLIFHIDFYGTIFCRLLCHLSIFLLIFIILLSWCILLLLIVFLWLEFGYYSLSLALYDNSWLFLTIIFSSSCQIHGILESCIQLFLE